MAPRCSRLRHNVLRWCGLLSVFVCLGSSASAAHADAGGAASQLGASDGCISDGGFRRACANGVGLNEAFDIKLSPDGRNAYVASGASNAVSSFSRDASSGALTELKSPGGCISEDGSGGACQTGHGLELPYGVAVSPDGKNVYVASLGSDSITVFVRDATTGALTQLSGDANCLSASGTDGCEVARGLNGASTIAISPDGKTVYVAADGGSPAVDGSVAVFARAPDNGALTQLAGTAGCVSETGNGGACSDDRGLDGATSVAITSDGKYAYVASLFGDSVAVFARDPDTGALIQQPGAGGCIADIGSPGDCAMGHDLDYPHAVALSPDDKYVYVAAVNSDAISVFARDSSTGALTQLAGDVGCISDGGSGGSCRSAHALGGPIALTLSADGRRLYVASYYSDAIATFRRGLVTGGLRQMAGLDGCVAEGASDCATGVALKGVSALALAPPAANLYAVSPAENALSAFALAPWSAPSCTDGTYAVGHDTAQLVSLACSDPDTDTLTLSVRTPPAHGTLSGIDQVARTVTYTPTAGYAGTDSFSFDARDPDGLSTPAQATLRVAGPKAPGPRTDGPPTPTSSLEPAAMVLSEALSRLPVARRCATTASLRFPIVQPGHARVSRATFGIRRRSPVVRVGSALTAPLALRPLPRTGFTLRIKLWLEDGRQLNATRWYGRCSTWRRR